MLAGRDLELFPALAREWTVLVTFNGLSFDVPILRRAFPDWTPPEAHVDLRHVLARLGHDGGLKAIERRLAMLNLKRPAHLDGIDGWDACSLYRRGRDGDRASLRRFAEYNLYDAINLRALLEWAVNEIALTNVWGMDPLPVFGRGDVLYDLSKLLLTL